MQCSKDIFSRKIEEVKPFTWILFLPLDYNNETYTEICSFNSAQEFIEIKAAAADLFHTFKQSIKFYTIHRHMLKSTDGWTR